MNLFFTKLGTVYLFQEAESSNDSASLSFPLYIYGRKSNMHASFHDANTYFPYCLFFLFRFVVFASIARGWFL